MSLKYVLVFSTLFGVVEYASRWPRDLPDPRKYVRGTYAYDQWEQRWYICGLLHDPKHRKLTPAWEVTRESSVPPKYVMTLMVYPS